MSTTIIDSHVHLWHQDSERYPNTPWVQGSLPKHDGTAERLVQLMDEVGVTAALNVQVPWYGEDNRYYHEMASKFAGRLSLLGVVDPVLADAPAKLDRMLREEGAQGLRIHLNEPGRRQQVQHGSCDPVIALAGELGVPVQFLARMGDMEVVRRCAEKHSRTAFVVDHLGMPDLTERPPYPSASGLFALGDLPNVYVKVSLLCDHSRECYPYPDVQEFVRHALGTFGAQRLMWGSNFPLVPELRTDEPVNYRRSLDLVRQEWLWLDEEDKDWILGKTAVSLWKFPAAQRD